MFPFNYIPEKINPTVRKILISLIIIQFLAFLVLMITLIYEYCTHKKENVKPEDKDNKKEEGKEGKDIKEKSE